MQLTLLLSLPLLASATTTSSNTPRGITDKVKGVFGDPNAIIREFSDCMTACSVLGLLNLQSCEEGTAKIDCYCQKRDGNGTEAAAGQAWEDGVRLCHEGMEEIARENEAGEGQGEGQGDTVRKRVTLSYIETMGCRMGDYDEGKILDVCGALEDKSAEEKNETSTVYDERLAALNAAAADGEKGAAVQGGNGTVDGKESGAAGAAGPGVVARVAAAALGGAVAYAVAML
jgi:hypothetical protein